MEEVSSCVIRQDERHQQGRAQHPLLLWGLTQHTGATEQRKGTIRPFPVVCQVGGCRILGARERAWERGPVGRERQRLRREEKYGVRKGGEKGNRGRKLDKEKQGRRAWG